MNYRALVIIGLLFFATSVIAQDYYADVVFDVSQSGDVSISGTTNHPALTPQTTQTLTTKAGRNWGFEINLPETFSEYVYEIKFPEGTQIIQINASGEYRISSDGTRIKIIGTGEKLPLQAKVTYQIQTEGNPLLALGLAIIAIILVSILIVIINSKFKIGSDKQKEKPSYNKEALTQRQLQIVEHLEKANRGVTQAEMQKLFNLPKASLSRNLESLQKKGIIKKERKGMAMLVSLKKD